MIMCTQLKKNIFISLILNIALTFWMLCLPSLASAQEYSGSIPSNPYKDDTARFLQNFATYFGINVERAMDLKQALPFPSPDFTLLENIGTFLVKNQLIQDKIANSTLITSAFSRYRPNPAFDQKPYTNDPTWQAITNFLTTPPTEEGNCYPPCLSVQQMQKNLITAGPGLGISLPYPLNTNLGLERRGEKPNPRDQGMNLNTLLGPLNYQLPTSVGTQENNSSSGASSDNTQQSQNNQELAEFFVRYVTAQVDPIKLPTLREYKEAYSNKNPRLLLSFLARLANFTASSSVSISNFNEMYARRVPNPKLNNLSQAQVEYQMATRRLTGPINPGGTEGGRESWHKSMEEAPPIILQRQMLYLLAEINYQLYANRLQNERILATLSAMNIQTLDNLKQSISLSTPGATTFSNTGS